MQRFTRAGASRAPLTLALALVGATVIAACSESGDVLGPGGAALDHVPGQEQPDSIRVCAAGPAGTYQFSVSSGAGNAVFPAGTSFSLANGSCLIAWRSGPHSTNISDDEESVTIVQTNQPAGTVFDSVSVFAETGTFSTGTKSATLVANFYHGGSATFFNSEVLHPGFQGCTPGYWKNAKAPWPIASNTSFNTIFGIGTNWFANSFTLGSAIDLGGGAQNALARHATAALLNAAAAGVDYPLTSAQIIALVQEAYGNSSKIEANKDILAGNNELGCPLNNNGK